MRDELDARDKQLSDTVAEIEKFREDQHSLKVEVEDRGSAIVTLQTELDKVRGELEARDVAIATLKAELAAKGEVKQLSFFPPEPTPEPEPIPKPESNPDQTDTTGTVDRSGLLEFINKNFPDDKIKPKQITNAVYRNGVGLSKLESKYGFKFVGTTENGNQFKLI